MTKDDADVASAVRAALAQIIGQDRFEIWFGAATRFSVKDGTLRVGTSDPFVLDCLRTSFLKEVQDACQQALGCSLGVEFVVDETAVEALSTEAPTAETRPTAAELPPVPMAAAAQNGNQRRFARLDDFVVGRCNKLAFTSAQSVAEQPGRWNPLFLYGPTGAGKTHLLEGVWSAMRHSEVRQGEVRHSAARRHVVYLSAEQFTTAFLDAMHGRGLPMFRNKYRGVSLLIVDDIQFICNKKATAGELLHTYETLAREGQQLVFAADRPLAELAGLGSDLLTRLGGGLVCRLDPPDYETRLGILARFARLAGLHLPATVAEFIASRLTAHARELAGAVNCLHAASRAWGEPVSTSLAEQALGEMIRHSTRTVHLRDIDKAVCEVFGIEPSALKDGSKSRELTDTRILAMWLARKHTRAALAEIGRYFGRRSHSTVLSAQKKVSGWMEKGDPLSIADHRWTAEEAIRRVEEHLRIA